MCNKRCSTRSWKILVTGWTLINTCFKQVLVRYNTHGELDSSFGHHSNGKIIFSLSNTNEQAYTSLIQPDSKILIAGEIPIRRNH